MQEAQTSSTTPMRQNAQGHWVPENLIASADKLRDEGKLAESRAKVDESLAALTRAEAAMPSDLMAPLRDDETDWLDAELG